MDFLSLLLEYVYLPMAWFLYNLHIDTVKHSVKITSLESSSKSLEGSYKDSYALLQKDIESIKIDLHHLVKSKEEESKS